ncbi:MAG TPA: hypothetical protein VGH40_00350 [Roseiarcus sp.]
MRISRGNTFDVLRVAAFVVAAAAGTPASAMGGGPTDAGGFESPGDFGAHFDRDATSFSGGYAGDRARRQGGEFRRGGYSRYYRGYNCSPALVAQNPEMCR